MSRIVLDANIVGRGRFNLGQLERLAAHFDSTLTDLVIPEVVIWEWAEHVHGAIERLTQHHADLRVDPAVYPTPRSISVPEKDDLIGLITAAIPRAFDIWMPSKADLAEAVRSQVLQVGAGERKDGVKTGAADQLILQAVKDFHESAGTTEVVVLGTNDRHLTGECKARFGDGVVVASDINRIFKAVAEFVPAEENLIESVEANLRSMLNTSGFAESITNFSLGFDIRNPGDEPSPGSERARLGHVEIVELHRLEIGDLRKDGTHLGAATLRFFGPVHLTVWELERVDEDDFEPVLAWEDDIPGMVDIPATLTFDQDWNISATEAAGRAIIDFDQFDHDDE